MGLQIQFQELIICLRIRIIPKLKTRESPSSLIITTVLKELKCVWKQYPDLRLGQLICDIVPEDKLYCVEDDMMLEQIKKWKKYREGN